MTDDDDRPSLPDHAEQHFAANLRILREREGMSQVKLAQEMSARGWPWRQQTVTRIENGQRMVRFGEATAVAAILRTSLDRFTWASAEANETEFVYAAGARLRQSYEAVAEAVCHLLANAGIAERVLERHRDSKYERVREARDDVAARIQEYSLEEAIEEGVRRYEERHDGEKDGEEEKDGGEEEDGDDEPGEEGEVSLAGNRDATPAEGALTGESEP